MNRYIFFKISVKIALLTKIGLAAELLPPKFKREIPEDRRYSERLETEFDLIDKNGFT